MWLQMLAINRILLNPVATLAAIWLVDYSAIWGLSFGKIQSCANWAQHRTNSGRCLGKYICIYIILAV